jgi:hypothetical protein
MTVVVWMGGLMMWSLLGGDRGCAGMARPFEVLEGGFGGY